MDGAFEPRLEDYRLLTGAGNFQDDDATAGAAWGVFVRSPHAFADIRVIDTASAQAVPGVLAVLTAAALDATGIGSVPVPVPGIPGMVSPHRPSLARDCVRHVGDPVALVIAGSEAEARDAAELVEVDYAARDAVTIPCTFAGRRGWYSPFSSLANINGDYENFSKTQAGATASGATRAEISTSPPGIT